MGKYRNSYLKLLLCWLPALIWAGLIFYLSSIPGLSSGLPVFYDIFYRKIAHAGVFAILFLLIFWALRSGHGMSFKKTLLLGFILAVLYAFSDEAHQYFVPLREAKLSDVGIDSLGIIFSGLLVLFFRKK